MESESSKEKFRGKYRRGSRRLQGFDYASNGAYFVTICTKNRTLSFGEIRHGIVGLNPLGLAAHTYWRALPDHFPFVVLDEFVVMPDHVHGILIIDKPHRVETPKLGVSTAGKGNPNWKPGILGVIINQYKRACTLSIRKIYPDFGWQSRFHDHVVRNEEELNRIRQYIQDNPKYWGQNKEDRLDF